MVDNCFQSVLVEWLQNAPSPCTGANLLEALKSNTLRENRLAADLEEGEREAVSPLRVQGTQYVVCIYPVHVLSQTLEFPFGQLVN